MTVSTSQFPRGNCPLALALPCTVQAPMTARYKGHGDAEGTFAAVSLCSHSGGSDDCSRSIIEDAFDWNGR